jgi:hypothetical protein
MTFIFEECIIVPFFRIRIQIRMSLGLPDPDPLVRGADPRIRIRISTKMSRIPNTVSEYTLNTYCTLNLWRINHTFNLFFFFSIQYVKYWYFISSNENCKYLSVPNVQTAEQAGAEVLQHLHGEAGAGVPVPRGRGRLPRPGPAQCRLPLHRRVRVRLPPPRRESNCISDCQG